MFRNDIVSSARSLLGVRYHHAGRSPKHGIDCVGLLTCVADILNYPYTDLLGYSNIPDGKLSDRLLRFLDKVDVENRGPGDVGVFWCDRHTKSPQHVGIFTDIGLIHVDMHTDKVVEHSLSKPMERRLLAVLRFKGLED